MHGASSNPERAISATVVPGELVEGLYDRFASLYDRMFGPLLQEGRREAIRECQVRPGDEILEVGIGTGLTASLYPSTCTVTGIDVSEAMLREARRHVRAQGQRHIRLRRMDAGALRFPDRSFDVVYAAYVISVVPDPVAALREMVRVCRVGGQIVLLNHFLSANPLMAVLERLVSPLAASAGFRTDLSLPHLLGRVGLTPQAMRMVNTPRIWTLVRCRRDR